MPALLAPHDGSSVLFGIRAFHFAATCSFLQQVGIRNERPSRLALMSVGLWSSSRISLFFLRVDVGCATDDRVSTADAAARGWRLRSRARRIRIKSASKSVMHRRRNSFDEPHFVPLLAPHVHDDSVALPTVRVR